LRQDIELRLIALAWRRGGIDGLPAIGRIGHDFLCGSYGRRVRRCG
jgi:hypothetical protein